VATFDADQPRGTVTSWRVDIALVVQLRHPWPQRVRAQVTHLARLTVTRGLHELPVAHDRLAFGLAVDRPVLAVIVRLALFGAVVYVGQDAEAELRVFVKDLTVGHVIPEVLGDEALVAEHVSQQGADLLPTLRRVVGGENAMSGGGKVLEGVR